MASRKSTGSKTKSKTAKPSRASATAPKPPAALRTPGGVTTMVPKPQRADATPDAGDAGEDLSLKKQELIALVVERSDVAKKHAKPVIEAVLTVLGDAIAEGRELNLQPMGKIKRKKLKDTDKARVIIANIRQSKAAQADATSPAAPAPSPSESLVKLPVADDAD